MVPPVVAAGTIFVVTENAQLLAYVSRRPAAYVPSA